MQITNGLDTIVRIGGKYRLRQKIGSGSFGVVYPGYNIVSKRNVAIKLETINTKQPSQLENEIEVYKKLASSPGIPSIHWFGTEGDYNAMVLDHLGPSLEDLFGRCSCKFSLKTVLLLADQLISHLECIYSRDFIHRDLKPSNFLTGINEHATQLSIIDFGLTKKYRDSKTCLHIPSRDGYTLTGTVLFASINNHWALNNHDVMTWNPWPTFSCIFFTVLFPGSQRGHSDMKILEQKSLPPSTLCSTPPLSMFLDYTRKLAFDEKPDYTYLCSLFHDAFKREGYQRDYVFNWCMIGNCLDNKAVEKGAGETRSSRRQRPERSSRVLRSQARQHYVGTMAATPLKHRLVKLGL